MIMPSETKKRKKQKLNKTKNKTEDISLPTDSASLNLLGCGEPVFLLFFFKSLNRRFEVVNISFILSY